MKNSIFEKSIKECDDNLKYLSSEIPSSSSAWIYFTIITLFVMAPFFLLPLIEYIFKFILYTLGSHGSEENTITHSLHKVFIEINNFSDKNKLNIDIDRIERASHQNYIFVLFYAIPMGIVITHGISISAWKFSIKESIKFRLEKIKLQKMEDLINSDVDNDLKLKLISCEKCSHEENVDENTLKTDSKIADAILSLISNIKINKNI